MSDRIQFYISFPCIPSPVVDVWRVLSMYLEENKCLPRQFEVAQLHSTKRLKLSANECEALFEKGNYDRFWVNARRDSKAIEYYLLHAKNLGEQSRLCCLIENQAKAPSEWKKMIENLMISFPSIASYQWRGLYKLWQSSNRLDLGVSHYESRWGVFPPGFKSWNEPDPCGDGPGIDLIDISLNPGRSKEILPTISFHPTAEMWLGPHFWQYAKCSKEEVLAADFFLEKRDTPHFLYLKCWPEPFSRPDGEQGRMQQRLWQLFFHETCEWPPGSGAICDEPMYGPPELMPGYQSEKDA